MYQKLHVSLNLDAVQLCESGIAKGNYFFFCLQG